MSNVYCLPQKALLLSLLLLLVALRTPATAFQVMAVRRTAIAGKFAVWGSATNSGNNENGDKVEECIVTDMERARDCASNVGECDVEELEDLSNELHQERIQNEIFGMCSEQELEMERIELELQKQLHGFADEMSAKFPKTPKQVIETKVNHAIHSAAKFVSSKSTRTQKKTTKVQMVKPPTVSTDSSKILTTAADPTTAQNEEECVIPPDVGRARDCATNVGECSVQELEMLEKGLRQELAQHEIFGMCDEEDKDLQMIGDALRVQLERFV